MFLQVESIPQTVLASRLTLNCLRGYVEAHKLSEISITIIDVFDECALSTDSREEVYKCYPHAKLAHLKSGGNFPYLSRAGEVNLHLQVRSLYSFYYVSNSKIIIDIILRVFIWYKNSFRCKQMFNIVSSVKEFSSIKHLPICIRGTHQFFKPVELKSKKEIKYFSWNKCYEYYF